MVLYTTKQGVIMKTYTIKQPDKALPINIEMLTKENRNDNKT